MWKASAGHNVALQSKNEDDDWETDPDFVNDVTEEEQRWGAKTIAGSGRTAAAIDMAQLRQETEQADATKKKKEMEIKNPGLGYGGKFGIETDRMDKSAVGHDYISKVEKHGSQTDYSDGFGGKFGVQKDRVDKSAAGWDHKEKVVKHSSQKDYSDGFGGKFGVQNDRVDKSAVGWDHVEKVEKHESQKDYSKGFGGKFGVQEDRKDKSAVGWDYIEAPQKHESQMDHKVGFGGKFGVQNDRMDKSAISFKENPEQIGTNYTKTKPDIGSAKPSNLRAKFENFAKIKEEEDLRRTAEQKRIREEKDRLDREQAVKGEITRNSTNSTIGTENGKSPEQIVKPQRKGYVDTGRSGGIGNARDIFNKPQSPEEAPVVQRKEPIKLPKDAIADVVDQVQPPQTPPVTVEAPPTPQSPIIQTQPISAPFRDGQVINGGSTILEGREQYSREVGAPLQKSSSRTYQLDSLPIAAQAPPPDVIPTQKEHPDPEIIATLPPPAAFTNTPSPEIPMENRPEEMPGRFFMGTEPPVLSNQIATAIGATAHANEPNAQEQIYSNVDIINEQQQQQQHQTGGNANQLPYTNAISDDQIDLAEYIEDTGIVAIACYDYEATADDEISFDPNDIITHIEQIDEGWWRGLNRARNQYGLFPANYVQLQK